MAKIISSQVTLVMEFTSKLIVANASIAKITAGASEMIRYAQICLKCFKYNAVLCLIMSVVLISIRFKLKFVLEARWPLLSLYQFLRFRSTGGWLCHAL